MKCQVQWVDENGKPTPDDNEAVRIANFHRPIWEGGKIVRYEEEIQAKFPICAKHYAQVTHKFLLEFGGGWTFESIGELA